MSARTSVELIEAYLGRLRAELASVGAAEADDLVAEVRSMLVEAAGRDAERAAAEIASLGEPAELAAGILAERGLSADGGISAADWWRMGIAVPIDIVVGASVPIAAFVPLYLALTAEARPDSPVMLALFAVFAGALAWPWYVWRPWRSGGSAATAGMALTGIAVVRAPGFWRVVRASDLASLGLASPRRSRITAIAPALLALLLVGWSAQVSSQYLFATTLPGRIAGLAGSETEQERAVTEAVGRFYDAVVAGDFEVARPLVADIAWGPEGGLALMKRRAATDKPVSYRVHDQRLVKDGVWSVRVTTTAVSGAMYTDTITLGFNLLTTHTGAVAGGWMITNIEGPQL